jgi:hypothetical protein
LQHSQSISIGLGNERRKSAYPEVNRRHNIRGLLL